ncbi:MAG TPA: hypothetical protein VNX68_12795 [Nitrosopumilaceae archaeon]|jgi:hypothetical protein|nr:hypothetical protein [Nitrosopumilaceae archaeon]
MAITINSSPSVLQPVYNPFYWNVISSNVGQPNFRYVVDIYTGATASTYVSRLRILPRPVTTTCVTSPARVLESYISYDRGVYSNIGGTPTQNEILQYTIEFGEEYGSTTTGTTTYANLNVATGYTWNAVVPYDQLSPSVFSFNFYILSGNNSNSNFLTNMPSTVYFKNATDRASLSWINNWQTPTLTAPGFLTVIVSHTSGGTSTYEIRNDGWTGATPQAIINHFGIGPWNLNNTPASLFLLGTPVSGTGIFNFNTDYQYTVQAYYNGFTGPLSKIQTYVLDDCTKYIPVRLQWLNELGGWDYFNFSLISRKTISANRGTYKKTLAYNYTVGDRGTTVIDVTSNESVLVTGNYINDDISSWLSKSLMTSTEVYEQKTDGTILPIIISDSDKERLKRINDRLYNYEFNYTYAFPVATQRN